MTSFNSPIQNWKTQRVWVVGASSGIGAAFARSLLQAGAQVAVSARREDELNALVASVPGAAARVLAFDAADETAWPEAYARLRADWPQIDLVVFVAARYDPVRAWELTLETARKGFELNVLSVYRGIETVLPDMLQQGRGGLALVASVAGMTGLPKASIYGATKAALINLAQTLYFDLAPKGLSVYLINPGFVKTPMTDGNDFSMPDLITPEQAASAMVAGIAAGQFEICFPRRFTRWLKLLSCLPYGLRFRLLHKATGL